MFISLILVLITWVYSVCKNTQCCIVRICSAFCVYETESESCSDVSDSLPSHGLYNPWNIPGQKTGVGSCSLLQEIILTQGIKPRSPALQVDSLPAESPGKPKNTGVGSLSLLKWIFLTQESNQSLLHCRWILYQLSYQGSPLCV